MGSFLGLLMVVGFIVLIIKSFVIWIRDRIADSKENKAIEESGIKQQYADRKTKLDKCTDSKIAEVQSEVDALFSYTFSVLPELSSEKVVKKKPFSGKYFKKKKSKYYYKRYR